MLSTINLQPDILMGLALGLGLSASCGFRVFIPMLIASVAANAGWLHLADNFAWLGSLPAILCFGTAAVAEVLAYYIPVIDNLLDTIATPAAVIAGTVLSASTFVHLDPSWQWVLGIIVGGGSAGIIQAGTVLSRAGSTKMTVGTGNHALATGEILAATSVPILTMLFPVVMALTVIVLITVMLYVSIRMLRKKQKS